MPLFPTNQKAKRLRAVAALLLAFVSFGCGSGSSSFTPASTALLKPGKYSDLTLRPLRCADPLNCPNNIGQLVSLTLSGPELCTVTLVSPKVVLTASHCLPWQNMRPDRTIAGNCWVRFPDENEEPVACKAVLQASELSWSRRHEVQTDYALIELEQSLPRRPWRVAGSAIEGVPPQVVLYGVSPHEKEDLLTRYDCAIDRKYSLITRQSWSDVAMIMPNCPIVFGNSGGPIFDPSNWGILGVISFIDTAPGKPTTAVGTRVPDLLF